MLTHWTCCSCVWTVVLCNERVIWTSQVFLLSVYQGKYSVLDVMVLYFQILATNLASYQMSILWPKKSFTVSPVLPSRMTYSKNASELNPSKSSAVFIEPAEGSIFLSLTINYCCWNSFGIWIIIQKKKRKKRWQRTAHLNKRKKKTATSRSPGEDFVSKVYLYSTSHSHKRTQAHKTPINQSKIKPGMKHKLIQNSTCLSDF